MEREEHSRTGRSERREERKAAVNDQLEGRGGGGGDGRAERMEV